LNAIKNKGVLARLILPIALVLSSFVLTGCEKHELDRQMNALCAKDGGNKVYETVKLPAKMFSESGQPFFNEEKRSPENKLGSDYIYSREEEILKDGDIFKGQGRLTKSHITVVRKLDSKIMGESIEYSRGGGDGFVIGHPTSNSCANGGGPIEKSIFIKQ
jgi:hypothetical protein